MKLNRDNFLKQGYDGGTLYQYVCNDTNFFLFVKGQGSQKNIKVFKGNVDAQVDTFETKDSLEAWNKFEEMLTECQPKQTTSGGFKNNPQQNPNILPLLAIRKSASGWDVVLFVEYENQQIDVMNFQLTESALPNPLPQDLTIVNWTDEEIPTILKCEVIIKKVDKKFEANPSDDVFLFIPKSIVEQGGEEGGNTEAGEEGEDGGQGEKEGGEQQGKEGKQKKDGKGKKGKKDGKEQNDGGLEGGESEDNEPSEKEPSEKQPSEEETKETDEGLKGGDEEEQEQDEESKRVQEKDAEEDGSGGEDESNQKSNKPTMKKPFSDFPEAITRLSEISGVQPSTLINVFRTPTLGETWLLTNNFRKIKSELNLPSDMTALELSKSIINSK